MLIANETQATALKLIYSDTTREPLMRVEVPIYAAPPFFACVCVFHFIL